MSARYRRHELLAKGGMGIVYLGAFGGEAGFARAVAIKYLRQELCENPLVVSMFEAEARLSRHLVHPNIVQVLDVGRDSDGIFLVMEYVEGWTLDQVRVRLAKSESVLPPHLVGWIASQVLRALAYAYHRQVDGQPLLTAHRDVSPSNVLLSHEGEVKVVDFGVAKVTASNLTEPGLFKGKPLYAAPEVLRGAPASWASDQFSLGVMLHELAAGRHPFGAAEPLFPYVERMEAAQIHPLPPGVGALAPLIRVMLSPKPADRYASADAASLAIEQCLLDAGQSAHAGALKRFLEGLDLKRPLSAAEACAPTAPELALELARPAGPTLAAPIPLVEPAPAPLVREAMFSPSPATLAAPPLELSPPRQTPEVALVGPKPRRKVWPVLAGGAVLGLALLGFAGKAALAPRGPPLTIVSKPEGAEILIDGVSMGETPYAGDNPFGAGAKVVLKLKGFKPWSATLSDSREQTLVAPLTPGR